MQASLALAFACCLMRALIVRGKPMIAFASRFFSALRSSLTTPALQPPLDYSTMPHYSSANNALLAADQGIRNLQGRQARAGLLRLLPFWGEFRSVCQRGDHKPQIDSRLSLASVSARLYTHQQAFLRSSKTSKILLGGYTPVPHSGADSVY